MKLDREIEIIIPWMDNIIYECKRNLINMKYFNFKIALIFKDYYRFDSISTSVTEQAIVLENMGFEVTFFCNNLSNIRANWIKKRGDFKEDDFDIVYYHYYIGDNFFENILSITKPKILYYHGITTPPEVYEPYSRDLSKECKKGLLELKNLQGFDLIMSSSMYNIKQLKELAQLKKFSNYKIVNPVISVGRFVKEKKRLNEITNILYVGRIYSSKNIEGIIDFAKKVEVLIRKKVIVSLAGSKVEESYLQSLLKKANLENITLDVDIGLNDEEIIKKYENADVFVTFSHHEGFCIPLIEAMGMGLPIVTHNLTAIPETMSRQGIVVEAYDYKTAAEKLCRLWKNQKEMQLLIDNQKQYYNEKYSEQKTIQLFSSLINNFIQELDLT